MLVSIFPGCPRDFDRRVTSCSRFAAPTTHSSNLAHQRDDIREEPRLCCPTRPRSGALLNSRLSTRSSVDWCRHAAEPMHVPKSTWDCKCPASYDLGPCLLNDSRGVRTQSRPARLPYDPAQGQFRSRPDTGYPRLSRTTAICESAKALAARCRVALAATGPRLRVQGSQHRDYGCDRISPLENRI
jgi:hypothetical protein